MSFFQHCIKQESTFLFSHLSLKAQYLLIKKFKGTLIIRFKSGATNSDICTTLTQKTSNALLRNSPVNEYDI